MADDYVTALRKIRAILITSKLKERLDQIARGNLDGFAEELDWSKLDELGIDEDAWKYVTQQLGIDPKVVFCHPDILSHDPSLSLYYRGMSTLSLKAIREYAGSVESAESGKGRKFSAKQLPALTSTYNQFISAIIGGVDDWTPDDGHRAIIATMGITLDGVMRNKIGEVAEGHVRKMVVVAAHEAGLILEPPINDEILAKEPLPRRYLLDGDVRMTFGAEPDISFHKVAGDQNTLVCVIEIKGGTDPAGALERYGAAQKSFQSALGENNKCQNFFLSAVYTDELTKRIAADALVHRFYDIIELLEDKDVRDTFLKEVFHFTLRIS
ncbi:XcyI family restriction endonuclease [Mesorhizobium marinum]|uniref:XcyI family restriction endonuclease n=1 Tax=Mesorhizobium marinum TaxID=3228790 RepID=A0ABV3QZA3_9HYPH